MTNAITGTARFTVLYLLVLASCTAYSAELKFDDASVEITVADRPKEAETVKVSVGEPQTPAESLPRVLSINLCADQMVLLLADPAQILALSTLSQDPPGSYFHDKALPYAQANPTAEDIVPHEPDVVIAGPYTSHYTTSLLEELGIKMESLVIANSIASMLENIERVGRIVHQEARAADLVAQLTERLAQLSARVDELDNQQHEKRPTAAVYSTNGYTVGNDSMRGEAMRLAGWHNVAADVGIESYGVLNLENLISLNPEALIESPYSSGTYSRGQALTQHPALRQSGLDPLLISLPSNQTICAGPWSIDIVERLFNERESLRATR